MIEDINQFFYNGKRSYYDMGLIITQPPSLSVPERDVSYISIAGRSGDLIMDNGRYKNITVAYHVAAISDDFPLSQNIRKISAWLAGSVGYYRLSDTYDQNYYRMAAVGGAIDIEQQMQIIGSASISFNCKPFLYRTDGDIVLTIIEPVSLFNPEAIESVPYIKITGQGDVTLTINDVQYAFTGVDGFIECDGNIMAAYKGDVLQNNHISFVNFPTLMPGKNDISFTGNVSRIEIQPRWRAL